MNSPIHSPPNGLGERVARLEATVERILEEMRVIREEMREIRNDIRDVRKELRFMTRAIVGLAVVMAAAIVNLYR